MTDTLREQVLARLTYYQADILQFTQELMAIATENPPGRLYKPCVDRIVSKLTALELPSEVIAVPMGDSLLEPRYCVLSHYGSGQRTFYFHGHYDVVPAASPDQYQPYVDGERLYGRGSSDMKGGLAAMIYALKALQDCAAPLASRVGLTIVPDEETGGAFGSSYLFEAGILGRDGIGMLLAEPTSGVVWNANRGAISMRITVNGKPAHVGLQYQGVNAFERMLTVANALMELKAEVEARQTSYQIQPEAARASILMMGGVSAAGSNFNLVPGQSSFTIDRRINPEEDLATEKALIFQVLESVRQQGIELDVEVFQEAESAGASADHPVGRALAANIEAIKGQPPEFELCPGLLENRFYAQAGVPAYAYGPGLLSVSHGPAEYVEIAELYNCAAIYALTALDMLLGE